ncbi:MAG: ABC transporter substrate-binding protein [Desulfobacterales bacterium]|nr:MAG: ABC transporter substrate-binding protein [Desulfobacterales bacterium]
MKKRLFVIGLLFFMLVGLPLQGYAATGKESVENQVNKILTKLKEPGFNDQPRETKIAEVRKIINEIFDYTELSKRTLGKDWKKFSDAQQTEFISLFSALLENVYADRILAYTHEVIEFGKETELRKGQVEVESNIITADNKKVPLNYRLILKDNQWRVYDVVIEGVSMVKNYRSQFGQILSKQSPEDLLETLRKKAKAS